MVQIHDLLKKSFILCYYSTTLASKEFNDRLVLGFSLTVPPQLHFERRFMRIALFGYGKMGKLLEQLALAQGHEITAIFSRQSDTHSLHQTDVCLDFSHASCVVEHSRLCAEQGKNLIIGTTGWESQLPEVQKLIRQFDIGCLYAPNFSIGIYLFSQVIAHAAQLISQFDEYEVGALEYHHSHKKDSPSGTAKALIQEILHHNTRLDHLECASVRCGYIPGTHTILFDGPTDTMTFTHQARNREGFAYGALKAAEWLIGKKGFFTLQDMLKLN